MLKNSDSAREKAYLQFAFYEFSSLLLSGSKIVLPEIHAVFLLVRKQNRKLVFTVNRILEFCINGSLPGLIPLQSTKRFPFFLTTGSPSALCKGWASEVIWSEYTRIISVLSDTK